jgi:ribosome-associated protein YbcJ (S4-like RNA binding protein)
MNAQTIRLNKFLANNGIAARRKISEFLQENNVLINGKRVIESGTRLDPQKDQVSINGQKVKQEAYVYFLLNKPAGVVSSAQDEHGRKTVTDLISSNIISIISQSNSQILRSLARHTLASYRSAYIYGWTAGGRWDKDISFFMRHLNLRKKTLLRLIGRGDASTFEKIDHKLAVDNGFEPSDKKLFERIKDDLPIMLTGLAAWSISVPVGISYGLSRLGSRVLDINSNKEGVMFGAYAGLNSYDVARVVNSQDVKPEVAFGLMMIVVSTMWSIKYSAPEVPSSGPLSLSTIC